MKFYLIAGVGFSEMQTIADKLKNTLNACHGEGTAIKAAHGSIRRFSHGTETPGNDWCNLSGHDGLGPFGARLATLLTATTEHVVIFGPGVLRNLDRMVSQFTSNLTDTPLSIRITSPSNIVIPYVFKTNQDPKTTLDLLEAEWDKTSIINNGSAIIDASSDDIQAAKASYNAWCSDFNSQAHSLFGDFDSEDFTPFGGWNENCTPSSVGVGITDVTSITRNDSSVSSFTNNSSQYYITSY